MGCVASPPHRSLPFCHNKHVNPDKVCKFHTINSSSKFQRPHNPEP